MVWKKGGDSNTKIIAIIALAILLILAVGYIGFNVYQGVKYQQQLGAYQQGLQVGSNQALIGVMNAALSCQTVPMTSGNMTINLIAVECLQVPQQAQQ